MVRVRTIDTAADLLAIIAAANDSYEDIVWAFLNKTSNDEARSMTVRDMLEQIADDVQDAQEGLR